MAAQRWVLIVDDDPALAAHLGDLFRVEGFGVSIALDGMAALRVLTGGAVPDLLLLDMHLEGVSGWDVGAELKALGLTVPILVITGDPHPAACAAAVGAFAYLSKPFDLPALLAIIDQLPPREPTGGLPAKPPPSDTTDTQPRPISPRPPKP